MDPDLGKQISYNKTSFFEGCYFFFTSHGLFFFIPIKSRFCVLGSLDKNLVKGKLILCDHLTATEPFNAGAIGVIMQGEGSQDLAYSYPLSASYMGLTDGHAISLYINATRYIYPGRSLNC